MAWNLQKLRAAFELRGWLPWRQVLQQCPASWTGLSQSRAGQSCFMFLQFTFPDTLPRRLFCCQRKIKTNTHTLVSSPGVTAYCREKKVKHNMWSEITLSQNLQVHSGTGHSAWCQRAPPGLGATCPPGNKSDLQMSILQHKRCWLHTANIRRLQPHFFGSFQNKEQLD